MGAHCVMAMPIPRHDVLDQTSLCAQGTVGAYRHTLSVPLPDHADWDYVLPLGEPDDRDTWTEITEACEGASVLSVVLLTGQARLPREQAGVMSGELAEAWMTAEYARAGG